MKKLPVIGFFCLFLILFLFVFRSLIFNLPHNLIDWRDYPLANWIMYQNIGHIKYLQFNHLFDTNSFYPHPFSLLFADTFIPQSIIALPFSYVFANPILVFNITFVLVFILNYVATFIFWKALFKNNFLAFFGSLLIIFGPFFPLQSSHFQMLNYWPMFFALYFLMKQNSGTYRYWILTGLFIAIQFLASVYLAIFLVFMIFVYIVTQLFMSEAKLGNIKKLVVILAVFFLLAGIFIKGYVDMKNYYHISRDMGEYVNYEAHISDYFFSTHIDSIIHGSGIAHIWNRYDQHVSGEFATFPGILLTVLTCMGIFFIYKKKNSLSLELYMDQERLFFLIVLISGFLFSLGPRLSFNGYYADIPFLYLVLLKLPFFEAARALSRWSFILYLGMSFFALLGVQKIKANQMVVRGLILLVFFLEFVPISLQSHSETYITNDYEYLQKICSKDKKVILELPIIYSNVKGGVIKGLSYISKTQLGSLYHQCYRVNGYSGYEMTSLRDLDSSLLQDISSNNVEKFKKDIHSLKVSYIIFHKDALNIDDRSFLSNLEDASLVKVSSSMFQIKSGE